MRAPLGRANSSDSPEDSSLRPAQQASELRKAAATALDLSQVEPTENVVIYADTRQAPNLVETFQAVCLERGIDVTVLRTPHRFPETNPPAPAIEAMKAASFIVDMATESWVYAPAASEILERGARMLLIIDMDETSLVQRPPDAAAGERALAAASLLANAEQFHITSPEGTDFICRRGGRPYSVTKGYADIPGRFALYGASMLNFAPLEESSEGVLYLNGAQILYPQHTYVVEEPVRVEVRKGRIVAIDSSHHDGRVFQSWLEQFDENVHVVSHVGFGTDPRARLDKFDISAWESYYAGVIVAFGANTSSSLQGKNHSNGHSDSILLGATLTADGIPIIVDGEFSKGSGLRAE